MVVEKLCSSLQKINSDKWNSLSATAASSFPGASGEIGQGPLRISTITEGDPVIVGEIFVHQKIQ